MRTDNPYEASQIIEKPEKPEPPPKPQPKNVGLAFVALIVYVIIRLFYS